MKNILTAANAAFAVKYPEFANILELYREQSIGVSGLDTIVPRYALLHFQAGYTAGYNNCLNLHPDT